MKEKRRMTKLYLKNFYNQYVDEIPETKKGFLGGSIEVTSITPQRCNVARRKMGEALRVDLEEELNSIIEAEYERIVEIVETQIEEKLKALCESMKDDMKSVKSQLTELKKFICDNQFDGVLKSLFDEHLEEIRRECDKQKEEIKSLNEKCLVEIRRAKGES